MLKVDLEMIAACGRELFSPLEMALQKLHRKNAQRQKVSNCIPIMIVETKESEDDNGQDYAPASSLFLPVARRKSE